MAEEKDTTNKFIMSRDFMVKGFGYEIWFDANVKTHVPPVLHTEAMRCGAIALDKKTVVNVERNAGRIPEVQGEERAQTITRAMDALVAGNARLSFGADGLPTLKAIYRATGIELERNERDAIWQERVKQLAAKADPNSNTFAEPETKAKTKTRTKRK